MIYDSRKMRYLLHFSCVIFRRSAVDAALQEKILKKQEKMWLKALTNNNFYNIIALKYRKFVDFSVPSIL